MKAAPSVMAAPPALTLNTVATAGLSLVRMDEPGAFTFLGGKWGINPAFSNVAFWSTGATYAAGTSQPSGAVDFWLDTVAGTYDVVVRASVNYIRIAHEVNGTWQYVSVGPSFTLPSGGGSRYCTVAVGAAYRGRVRVEMDGTVGFSGVNIGATDTIRAVKAPDKRMLLIGDSFPEPTVTDTWASPALGFPNQLNILLGVDAWACGLGATGYLNTASGTKPTCRGRSADWLAYLRTGDIAYFCNGINDYATFTAAQIATELAACLALVPAGVEVVVQSPFWRNGVQTFPTNLLATRDAMQTVALAAGATFVDLLSLPLPTGVTAYSGTLAADLTASVSNTLSCDVPIPLGSFVQIGTGTNAEVRKTNNLSGSGPYTLSFGGMGPVSRAHTAGEVVKVVGPCIYTGTGRVGNLQANGNSDRYTGNDSTHPTMLGHLNIAEAIATVYTNQLAA
jgi:hypothetical protein